MKMAVNLTYLMDGKQPDGIGQFALNLFKGMQAIGRLNNNMHLFVFDAFQEKARRIFPEAKIIPVATMGDFHQLNKYFRFLKSLYIDRRLVPRFLKKDQYDLLFHPFNSVNDHISAGIPTVITLHDLFFKNNPGELSPKYLKYVKFRYEGLIYKTRHIVVPSKFVRQDIMKYYPDVDQDKISVINDPIWINIENTIPYPVKKPYILCVNSIRNHKNVITLLKAFQLIEDKIDHSLILTGYKGGASIDPEQYAAQNKIKKLIMTGYVSDAARNHLYQNADLFVSPSRHEGFGMTPVEAALFGIPVLTTMETSIPEITRGLVNYYGPADDYTELAKRMLELLKNRPPENELEHIKNKLSQEYDIKIIAERYYKLFEHLLKV